MSIIRVTKDDLEQHTIITTPSRTYSSGSNGVTGSIKISPRISNVEKKVSGEELLFELDGKFKSKNFSSAYSDLNNEARSKRKTKQAITNTLNEYFNIVFESDLKPRNSLEIERIVPTPTFTKATLAKNTVKEVLMKYYRTSSPNASWSYTNYNSLNFFTVSSSSQLIPTSSVLLYPNFPLALYGFTGTTKTPTKSTDVQIRQSTIPGKTYVTGTYNLSGAFTFDFYINPRYQEDGLDVGHFKAGTIFHLSSSFALSLVTGSSRDGRGLPDGFRLLLQLTQSSEIPPSLAAQGANPSDLIFLSDDNSLKYNNWHHVVVRWGSNLLNQGTGSFIVDGVNKGYFAVPSGTIQPFRVQGKADPAMLCIGNFYEGQGNSALDFFRNAQSKDDGVVGFYPGSESVTEPSTYYSFSHPLKAEIHDLSIRRYYMSDAEIKASSSFGPGTKVQIPNNFAFYLSPFFVQETRKRNKVLQTPYISITGSTDDPFNVAMSFGINGHYINLENFVKDYATSQWPRLLNLSASVQPYVNNSFFANDVLYQTPGVPKRNLTILPCDDGNFTPNYDLLRTERYTDKFRTTSGSIDWSAIYLDNLVSIKTLKNAGAGQSSEEYKNFLNFNQDLYGPTPEKPGLPPGPAQLRAFTLIDLALYGTDDETFDRGVFKNLPLTIFKELRDPSSNHVVLFNISNLYFGRSILPGSFTIVDASLTGSQDKVKITLKDDKLGNLYRADALTPHYTQNSVGNIFYDEGVVLIKSPHLFFFGQNQYEISFKGVNNIYSSKYEILANSGQLNSSSNPTYALQKDKMLVSGDSTDKEQFVYITGVNLHDENMNVICRTKVAQPVIKRTGDKILFKLTFDF